MLRLIIAIIVGALIGLAAIAIVGNALAGAANGTPSNQSLYQYGNR